jgi:hypothetical protein
LALHENDDLHQTHSVEQEPLDEELAELAV